MYRISAVLAFAAINAVYGAVGEGVSPEPVRIMDRDYWTLLESGPYSDPAWRVHGHWDSPGLARHAFLRDCGVVVKTSRWEAPPKGGAWPNLRENFSPRDNRCWSALEENAKKNKPLVVVFPPKGRFEALMGPVDLDHDVFRKWKASHPNLTGLRVLSEWGNEMAYIPKKAAALPESPLKEDWKKLLSGYDFNDRYDRIGFARWFADRKLALNYGDGDLFMALRSWVYLDHVAAAWGAKLLYTETTDSTGSDAEYRWDISAMFGRGASRQFGRPWVWYAAAYLNGFAEDGRWLTDSTCRYFAIRGNQRPEGGFSESLQRRSWYYAYLTGASAVEQENWMYTFLMTNSAHRTVTLSPRGKNFAEYHDFTRAHPDRGSVYAPVAVLVPFAQGYRAMGGKAWGVCPYLDGDHAVDSVFFTLAPGWGRYEAMRTKGAEGCLHNSRFAFMYDVLVPDSPQDEEEFLKVLSRYPAAVVTGEYRDKARLERLLSAYGKQGGRVLHVTPEMLPPNRGDDTVNDIISGKVEFPEVQKMLRGLENDYFPFEVEGDIAYGANKTPNGWWLWCMNNKGVYKFADKPERVDPSAASKIRVKAKPGVDASVVRELLSGRAVEVGSGVFEFTVPPGGIAVFEIGRAAKPPRMALPGEPETKPALSPYPFPDVLSAFVWRNWKMVPVEKLAKVVGATPEALKRIAGEMGLDPRPTVLPEWKTKGYITVVRRNWHLLDYDQLMELLDLTPEKLRFYLLEDDFLWSKLGSMKPKCGKVRWTRAAEERGRAGRAEIARILREEGLDPDAEEEPRFTFVKDMTSVSAGIPPRKPSSSPFRIRYLASYFADYGAPLDDPEVGSFPEGLLQKLAADGVNGVWIHVVLRTLVKDPKYPEFGAGSEERLANLRTLVARCAKYGMKVYLYLNEPRGITADFFNADPSREEIIGYYEERTTRFSLCTSSPETLRWLSDSVEKVFRAAPGLGGLFTITASENLTSCASHNMQKRCSRCAKRPWRDIIAEVNNAIIGGMHKADPGAVGFVWDWGWWGYPVRRSQEVRNSVLPKLPKKNVRILTVSEYDVPIARGGVKTTVNEYSISAPGPGPTALSRWRAAKNNGLGVAAKVQAGVSWEISPFPYLPVMDLVAEHAFNLAKRGIDAVMLSWSLGCAPAPNIRLWDLVRADDKGPSEVLDRLASERYGRKAAPLVRQAWTAFSKGFAEYPFHVRTLYNGPQNWGPANPLYPVETGYNATMVGFPYDDFTRGEGRSWRAVYPEDVWISQMDKVADGFDEGCRLFARTLDVLDGERRKLAERELGFFRAEALHFRSCAEQARFIEARDKGNRKEMYDSAARELAAAKALLPLVRADSRIGYECSNHYFYTPDDILEKVVGTRMILDRRDGR